MDSPISSPSTPGVPVAAFTADQWEALSTLRARHPQWAEFFSPHELTHLRFLRWLHCTGRLDT